MKRFLGILLTVVFAVAGVSGVAFASKKDWPASLKFVAGPPGGSWFTIGGVVSDVISKNVIPCTSSTGGGVSNIFNINKGKADLGLTVVFMGKPAMEGKEIFKKYGPQKNVAALTNLYKQYMYFVVRKDWAEKHGVKTVGDIFKKKLPVRMATLKPGTSSEYMFRRTLELGYGVTYKDIKKWGGSIQYGSYSDGANLIADNHIDLFCFTVSLPASIVLKMEAQTPITLLPVDEEARKKMSEAYGTTTWIIPKDAYKCIDKDIPTVGSFTAIIIRKDLPEDLVYEIVKALYKNKQTLADAVSAMKQMNEKDGPKYTVFPLHPGAAKFFKEAGTL